MNLLARGIPPPCTARIIKKSLHLKIFSQKNQNMSYSTGLKALEDGIILLSVFIQNKPKTMAEACSLYHTYYVGAWNGDAPALADYMKEIRTRCKSLAAFTKERKEDVEGYSDTVRGLAALAERCGLNDCTRYAYINTGKADEEQELREWKRVHLLALFADVSAALANIGEKLSGKQAASSKAAGIAAHSYPIPAKYMHIIRYVHDNLNDVAFRATESEFGTAVENADFSWVYGQQKAVKNKIAYMIYILSKIMGDEWYGYASASIGLKKKRCSGANVEADMNHMMDEVQKMKQKIKAG